ncbi:hypothetical protein GCM10007047_23570 [Cerasicoccus arenae]|uniref:Transposase TnpC homeodomain domain-containing protein n=1 Tax=Cerasicoccus arenae TaxID=424488 RepID=A0A8J3DD73_9BACT|nr:transposase [Cerasicoccus arenae]GHC05852.1 hypothetical protein GCM10007047_23570 [Cerasicoccus arenae]
MENNLLKEQVSWLKQQLFGSGKSERLDAAQLRLQLDELERQLENSATQSIAYERRVPKVGKHETSAERFKDLPVEETIVIEPEEVQAEPESFDQISQEETFEVDIHPPKLFKRCIVRPKYRRKADRSQPPVIVTAPPACDRRQLRLGGPARVDRVKQIRAAHAAQSAGCATLRFVRKSSG